MSGLVEHLESRLGTIRVGWTHDPDGHELPFQVVEFVEGRLEGAISYSTLGLSSHALRQADGREVRMELLATLHAAQAPARVPQAVQLVAKRLLADHTALARGDTFRLPGPVGEDGELSWFYAAIPGYFDVATLGDGTRVVIVWLVPITTGEANFIAGSGWPAFEKHLTELDPDLVDVHRSGLAVA